MQPSPFRSPPTPRPLPHNHLQGSILAYFEIFKPIWEIIVILLGYLGVMHLLTYGAYVVLARKERR